MKKSYQANKRCKSCTPCLNVINNRNGFSLVLIIALLFGLTLTAVVGITSSLKIMKINENKNDISRIFMVRDALQTYYGGHGDLPDPYDGTKIPAEALGLDQKYRIDTHGQFYYYKRNIVTGTIRTDINGLKVNEQDVAGIIIGFGPNQIQNTNDSVTPGIFKTADDDMVVPVNVMDLARKNCQDELQVLAEKLCAHGKASGAPTVSLADIINTFSLSHDYEKDPWLNENYKIDQIPLTGWKIESGGPDQSLANAADNIIVYVNASNCVP